VSRTKPATVRFYFDADVRGLGIILAQVRPDVTYPGDPGGELLEVVMCRWRDITDCLDREGPFVYAASRTAFERVPLE
jgi:hypothetical protein